MSVRTFTVDQLIARLSKLPSYTKVFMSSDQEGNGYSSIGAESFSVQRADDAVIIYPAQERLEIDDICPKGWEEQE